MTDFDRFTEFLLREAAGYNEPPETPSDAMWPGVASADNRSREGEPRVAAVVAREAVVDAGFSSDRRPLVAPVDYNRPPPAPREHMWARIESAWALRRAVPVSRLRPAWLGRRGAAGWVAALAAAASLVLGIGLGRGTRPSQPGETIDRQSPAPAAAPHSAVAATVVDQEPVESDGVRGAVAETVAAAGESTADPVDAARGGEVASRELLAANTAMERPRLPANRFQSDYDHAATRAVRTLLEPDFDYATARHMGRAATLLTAFRTDRRTPASQEDLAGWARELLAETRMYIGLSDSASPMERELLQDLELVLIQMSGLGPGAPDFEWDLARESMERQGTLTRLRAASAESET